jgi:hypothetical protein
MRLRSFAAGLITALLLPMQPATAQRGPTASWDLLGQQDVGFKVDNDTVAIRQSEEWFRSRAFTKLRFEAERNDVHLISIGLNYINGYSERVNIDRLIQRGSGLIVDLPGERSFLKSIDMRHRANILGGGGLNIRPAVVKVYGERIQRRWDRDQPVAERPRRDDFGPGWSEVDTQRFDRRDSRVVLNAGRGDGRFGQILLRSSGEPIQIDSLRIRFRNGETQTVRIGQRLEGGEQTRAIDLEGSQRFLDSVSVNLAPRNRPGRAELQLIGLRRPGNESVGGGGRPGGDPYEQRGFVLLGQQSVGFTTDRDFIDVAQSDDWHRNRAFRSLHLVAERNDIHMMGLRLIYNNGFAEDLNVDRTIPPGGDLAVDLRGDRSYLRRIELTYRSRPSFRGQAVIRVYGEPVRR